MISGKRIKMHVDRSEKDIERERERAALRRHFNSQYE
jgi:hypothetical protein